MNPIIQKAVIMSTIRSIALLGLMAGGNSLYAADLADMVKHSRLLSCEGRVCTDTRNPHEKHQVDPESPPIYGYVVDFTKEYTLEQIREATPHILNHYRNEAR